MILKDALSLGVGTMLAMGLVYVLNVMLFHVQTNRAWWEVQFLCTLTGGGVALIAFRVYDVTKKSRKVK